MRLKHADGRFWNGKRRGEEVIANWGNAQRTQHKGTQFSSAHQAKQEFATLLRKLESMGYRREIPVAVLSALAKNPRDEGALAVLADDLLAQGDVRGSLASLAGHRRAKEMSQFIEQHASELFGQALPDVESGRVRDLSWSWGFLFGATFDEVEEGSVGEAVPLLELVRRLGTAPVASLLRDVVLLAPWNGGWADSVSALSEWDHPEVLHSLVLHEGGQDAEDGLPTVDFDVSELQGLRSLEFVGNGEPGGLATLMLRRYSHRHGQPSPTELTTLTRQVELEALELDFVNEGIKVAHLMSLLKSLPRLRHLALRRLDVTDALVLELLELPQLRRLESLDLSACEATESEAIESLEAGKRALLAVRAFAPPYLRGTDDWTPDEEVRELAVTGWPNLVEAAWPARQNS